MLDMLFYSSIEWALLHGFLLKAGKYAERFRQETFNSKL